MIKDEAPEPASQTEEMPNQKRAVIEEPPSDSTDHLEEKEMGRTQAEERGNSWLSTAVSVDELLMSKKERKKLIETKILSKVLVKPSPKQDVKPSSHGINNGLGSLAKEETSAEHLGEVTHLSLQASGPQIKLWGCCSGMGAQSSACTVPLQQGTEVPSSDTPHCVTQTPEAVPELSVQVQTMAKAMDQQQGS